MRVPKIRTELPWSGPNAPRPVQPFNNLRLLKLQAAQMAPVLADIANEVARASDSVVRVNRDDEQPFPGVSIKLAYRAKEKVRTELHGRYDLLSDLLRTTVVCPTVAAAYAAARALVELCGARNIERLRDRITAPEKYGYADIAANVSLPNDHIAELQIITDPMYEAKQVEQVLYSERRLIEQGASPDPSGRHAILAGAASAIFQTARFAQDEERGLRSHELEFIRSFLR